MSEDQQGDVQAIIYSTPTCVYCKMAKEFFTEKGVTFKDVNVAEDEAARNEMIEATGQMGVPVIKIKDQFVIGFDQGKLAELLGIN